MQTFAPLHDSYEANAAVLDYRRLGKQRVECLQILRALTGEVDGWRNHPATKMWAGCEPGLVQYALAMIEQWLDMGYKDTCRSKIYELADAHDISVEAHDIFPSWWDSEAFHASHRSNLLRKAPDFYGRYGWSEPSDLEYVWPSP